MNGGLAFGIFEETNFFKLTRMLKEGANGTPTGGANGKPTGKW